MAKRRLVSGWIGSMPLWLLPGAALAADPKLQASIESSLGYTDNVRTTATNPAFDAGTQSRSVFLALSPGGLLALDSPRSSQRLSYRYEYNLFLSASNASSSSNRLDYRAFFELSRRLTLVLGVNAAESNRYATVAFAPPGAGVVSALPAGAGAFLQGGVDELLNFDVSRGWRVWQGVGALVEAPILGTVAPQTSAFSARAGAERAFLVDAVGLEAREDYARVVDGVRSDGSPAGLQHQLVTTAVASYRRDLGRYVTSSVEAGVMRVQRLEPTRGFWSPTGAASLGYANRFGDAGLTYAHTVTTNVLLGQSLLVDELQLRALLPLTSNRTLVLAATSGYQRGRVIDEEAERTARVSVVLVDVTLAFQATSALELGLRYQHVQQMSNASGPPLPVSFYQNNVLLGATLRLPPERDMPRAYRAPRRVDRSDEIREGVPTPDGARPPQAAPR